MFVDQAWFQENVQNIDPWNNVEVEPIFQYPIEVNEFLFNNTIK